MLHNGSVRSVRAKVEVRRVSTGLDERGPLRRLGPALLRGEVTEPGKRARECRTPSRSAFEADDFDADRTEIDRYVSRLWNSQSVTVEVSV